MYKADIAKVAHEVNRAYCQAYDDNSQLEWEDAPQWQRTSAMNGVNLHLNNPLAGPEASHMAWMSEKVATGWKYGPIKDEKLKEHPCIVPYDHLAPIQKAKDYLFCAVVHSLVKYLE